LDEYLDALEDPKRALEEALRTVKADNRKLRRSLEQSAAKAKRALDQCADLKAKLKEASKSGSQGTDRFSVLTTEVERRERLWREEKRAFERDVAARQKLIEGFVTERQKWERELEVGRGRTKELEDRVREAERKLEEAVSAARERAVPEGPTDEAS